MTSMLHIPVHESNQLTVKCQIVSAMRYNKNVGYRVWIQLHIPSVPILMIQSVNSLPSTLLLLKYQLDFTFVLQVCLTSN